MRAIVIAAAVLGVAIGTTGGVVGVGLLYYGSSGRTWSEKDLIDHLRSKGVKIEHRIFASKDRCNYYGPDQKTLSEMGEFCNGNGVSFPAYSGWEEPRGAGIFRVQQFGTNQAARESVPFKSSTHKIVWGRFVLTTAHLTTYQQLKAALE